jgi:hypothetical protein
MLKSQWAIKLKKGENTLNLKFFSRGAESLAETVAKPMAISRTKSPGPKAGMKPSKPAPDNTGLPIMGSGMAGSRMALKELGPEQAPFAAQPGNRPSSKKNLPSPWLETSPIPQKNRTMKSGLSMQNTLIRGFSHDCPCFPNPFPIYSRYRAEMTDKGGFHDH